MVDIWSGNIALPDGDIIKDVGLASPNGASSVAIPSEVLRFVSTVEVARIPLYLAAGPSLDVWTTCGATEAWFESVLLSKPAISTGAESNGEEKAWWTQARSQSPLGILVQVQGGSEEAQRHSVTEVLFYGTITPTPAGILPTPPSSSPEYIDAQLPALRVHALPLSSHLLYQQNAASIPLPASPNDDDAAAITDAQFLPPHVIPDSPKRKRDIFEEATIANKKARGKGGAGIAAAAAWGHESQASLAHRKSLSLDTRPSPFSDPRPSSANGALSRPGSRQLSRSPSLSNDARPLSRKGVPDGHNKRSTLSQVATVSLQPEEPTTESRNKEALSRVVMAAMRMAGMQQRKKNRPRRASVAPGLGNSQDMSTETATEEAAKDEEYKLMYHQTYKGAAFAFRKHITEKPLHAQPDQMRDVVEQLLAIYLNDPLVPLLPVHPTVNPVATPGGRSHLEVPGTAHSHASPFDLPSAARPGMKRAKTDSHVYTGSPVSKRKLAQSEAMPV